MYNDAAVRRRDHGARPRPAAARPSPTAAARRARARAPRTLSADAERAGSRRGARRAEDGRRDELSPRDHVEFLIALGESLYLDDQYALDDRYSAAAEQFEIALARADLLDAKSRDRCSTGGRGSLDRQAQQEPGRPSAAPSTSASSRARRANWRGRTPRSPRRTGSRRRRAARDDLPRAWGAAVAGWIARGSLGARGAALRADLDQADASRSFCPSARASSRRRRPAADADAPAGAVEWRERSMEVARCDQATLISSSSRSRQRPCRRAAPRTCSSSASERSSPCG